MDIPDRPSDIYSRMKQFKEFETCSNQQLHEGLTSRIKVITQVYHSEDHILIWKTLDKFALHVVSITDGFEESTFKSALRDLQRSEEQYDGLKSDTEKKTYSVLDQYLLRFFLATKRDVFSKIIKHFADRSLDPHVIADAMKRILKPSSLRDNDLLDVIVKRVWSQLSERYDSAWIKKRLRRVGAIEEALGIAAPKVESSEEEGSSEDSSE